MGQTKIISGQTTQAYSGIESLANHVIEGDVHALANKFNIFFHSVSKDLPPFSEIDFPSQSLDFTSNFDIGTATVERKLSQIIINKAAGLDGLPNYLIIKNLFLINTQAVISRPLAFFFAYIFHARKIPDAWRNGNITPFFKKGKSADSSNYRPISLTSNCCKVMKSIIKDQLFDYLKLNNLISRQQHVFFYRAIYVYSS